MLEYGPVSGYSLTNPPESTHITEKEPNSAEQSSHNTNLQRGIILLQLHLCSKTTSPCEFIVYSMFVTESNMSAINSLHCNIPEIILPRDNRLCTVFDVLHSK